jgi:ElaB/YqjD/DUF883 family membrane-anchored ribosome-binding protein
MEEATNPEELSKKVNEVSSELKETASAAVEQARSTVQAACQEAKSNITVLQTYTREHPIRAVLLALGMGVFLGSFVRR